MLSSSRPGSFFLFFRVLYVRSLHSVHASVMTGRFSALATVGVLQILPAGHAELGPVTGGKAR